MLRAFVLALGGVLAAAGAVALLLGACPPAFVFGLWGILILLGTLYERNRYKALETTRPGVDWTETPEKFIDDDSGATVTVYVNAAGERRYVRD
jgi:hypothetical protein